MNPLEFEVEVARSTGHPTAETSPTRNYHLPVARETSGALAFQLAQAMLECWPEDAPLDRRACAAITDWAEFEANSIKLRELAEF